MLLIKKCMRFLVGSTVFRDFLSLVVGTGELFNFG